LPDIIKIVRFLSDLNGVYMYGGPVADQLAEGIGPWCWRRSETEDEALAVMDRASICIRRSLFPPRQPLVEQFKKFPADGNLPTPSAAAVRENFSVRQPIAEIARTFRHNQPLVRFDRWS
jgi:hypothetical protein